MKESDDTRTRPISRSEIGKSIKSSTKTPEERAEEMESGETQPIPVQDITQVIQELPKEERQKIGLSTFLNGHAVEKAKSDFFAKNFDKLSKSKNLDKDGTVARFLGGLRDSFKADAEMAGKRIKDGKDGALATRVATKFTSVAYLAKNIIRPARILADAFGLSSAGGARLVMTAGIVTSRVAGAAKEARFANKELIKKTRIGRDFTEKDEVLTEQDKKDAEEAEKEAWKIYKNAQKHTGKHIGKGDNVTAEELKSAYLREIPKDLQERLRDPHTANTVTQKLLRKHMELTINGLNKKIAKIDEKHKFDITKKGEREKEQLLHQWEKRLREYDRILTQTGTVDQWASAARAVEFGSKSVVRFWTLESLYELWSNMGSGKIVEHTTSSEAQPSTPAPTPTTIPEEIKAEEPTPTPTPESMPEPTPSPAPEVVSTPVPPVIETPNFPEANITFDSGKGGIKGILELKDKLRAEYPDLSKAPQGVQDFINKDVMDHAKELKFLSEDGKSSLKIFKGATLKLDAEGNPVFENSGSNEDVYIENKVKVVKPSEFVGPPEPEVKIEESVPVEALEEEEPMDTRSPQQIKSDELDKIIEAEKLKTNPEVAFFDTHEVEQTPVTLSEHPDEEKIRQSIIEKMTELNQEQPAVNSDGVESFEPIKNFFGYTKNIAGNPFNLSDDMLSKVDETYSRNINNLFGEPAEWTKVKNLSAHDVLKHSSSSTGTVGSAYSYLQKLQQETGLKPKNSWWPWSKDETVEKYVVRVLQTATKKIGQLEKLKIK